MADQTRVSGSVNVSSDSAERVAFDMAVHIAGWEEKQDEQKDRKYWLRLVVECRGALRG